MARIPEHIIENIREVADIYDIVSEYVNLRKRVRNFFGLCPMQVSKILTLFLLILSALILRFDLY